MFRKNFLYKIISVTCILIYACNILNYHGCINITAEAKKTNRTEHLHFSENITAGQIFRKTYTIKASSAGIISAKVMAKDLGCPLRITIYGNNPRYLSGNTEIPEITLSPNSSGISSGTIKTNHIVMADTYRLSIQGLSPVKSDGTLATDLYFNSSSIEDNTYADISVNDSPKTANNWNRFDHRYHTFMLSGYREQEDYTDFYRIYIKKKMYISLRAKTVSNTDNTNYYIRLIRQKDNATVVNFETPGKAPSATLVRLSPGDYYLQVSASQSQILKNRQILYSIHIAKATNITSLKLNTRKSNLYQLKGYNTKKISSRINGKKASRHDVIYKSSHPSVASVSSTGKVTAKTCGKTTITCYAIDKPSVKATCRVIVKKPRLKISIKHKKLYIGNRTPCSVQKLPKKLKVAWKSTNPSVASVSSKGIVTGRSVGKARIYAISREGISSNPCSITVKKPQPKPTPKPDPKPTPEEEHDKIAPVLSMSSAHLSPKGTITVTANVSGGTFRASGAIAIKNSYGKSCVIRATAARGSGTISYQVNGRSTSKNIVIY